MEKVYVAGVRILNGRGHYEETKLGLRLGIPSNDMGCPTLGWKHMLHVSSFPFDNFARLSE